MSRKFFWLIVIFIVVIGAYFLSQADDGPEILTTNIDPVNKTINEPGDGASDEDTDRGIFLPALQTLVENISSLISDDMTMLAAAADPSVTFVKINPGMRKEEIANLLSKKLSWSENDENNFLNINTLAHAESAEGYYYPGKYMIPSKANGSEVGKLMIGRFNEVVMPRYASSTKKIINIDTAMKIASIIEREAGGKSDMRLISGIMWNRIFKDMTLDIDATLQYAKGSENNGWWPRVESEDKFIDSPYNTYQNKGLTPTPISNPNLASIEAALNPKKTSCLFYLHDKYRRIHCSATYKQHVANVVRYYGK